MKLGLVTLVAAVAVGAVAPASVAADECRGLMVCIPVAGPWVGIPAGGALPSAAWQLRCPEGVVGGVDARVSERSVGVEFAGRLGSPVNPGITTTDAVVFTGTYAGRAARATSFRPFIGCIPGGGGRRTPTGVSAPTAVRPGEPLVFRVKALRVRPGELARATHGCRRGERLVRSSHAIGLYTPDAPTPAQLRAVRVIRAVEDDRILVSATRRNLPATVNAVVQVQAVCARR